MITVNLLDNLNSMIQEEAPFLKITAERSSMSGREITFFNIRLQKTKYIDTENHPLNVTDELIIDIEVFLGKKGINGITWNNNYTTFWETN